MPTDNFRQDPLALLEHTHTLLPEVLSDIETIVACESPSSDLAAVASSAAVVAEVGTARLGIAPDRIVVDGCTHLRWRLGEGVGPRVLLLGHHDTVWPLGSARRRPVATKGVLTGPGCFDMKTGVVMAIHAAAVLTPRANITILLTGDEELGSQTSRDLIEAEARDSVASLVLEGASAGGAVKVARKGAATYRIAITGKAAHAGLEPERGLSATRELALQILAVQRLSDPATGTTVAPTRAWAGTTTNTIADTAECFVDVRAWSPAEQRRVDVALRALAPQQHGITVEVTRRRPRPPMTSDMSRWLFGRAQLAARRLGSAPLEGSWVGGASDGNLTAALGTPTLDGMGAVGGGAHTDDEHVLVDQIPERLALLILVADDMLTSEPHGRPAR